MTISQKKHRIIFIDLIRAFAVLQMVQGHTINVVLAEEFRNLDFPFYAAWHFMRGTTAPIFLFTAGTVFTYLFRLVDKPFFQNPRFVKGIKRAGLLLVLGYLLRYPSWTIVDFSEVTEESWKIFLRVDILQLIGFGLFLLLALLFLSEKFFRNDYVIFGLTAIATFLVSPMINAINWINYFPEPVAAYFYSRTGSLFPVFPWVGYIISGALLGSYLAKNPLAFKSANFSIWLATIGSAFILSSVLGDTISNALNIPVINSAESTGLVFFRLGFVLVINALVSYIALKIDTIPKFIILVGRNTLLIYVVHLIILYGSAWNPGVDQLFASSLNGLESLIAALVMILLMTLMVLVINLIKMKNKPLVA